MTQRQEFGLLAGNMINKSRWINSNLITERKSPGLCSWGLKLLLDKISELYDPVTASWTAAANNLIGGNGNTATLLPNSKVLTVGSSTPQNNSQLYDVASGNWTLTGNFAPSRQHHSADLLPNNLVLAAGGIDWSNRTIFANAELYNFVSGIWLPTGSLNLQRNSHISGSLPNGKVLVIGGIYGYSPMQGGQTATNL